MKLAFLSNYYTHHQKPTCDQWYRMYGADFAFVATEPMDAERLKMGWHAYADVPFVVSCDARKGEALPFDIEGAEQVILGNAPMSMVKSRLKKGRPVYKYSERVFKHGYQPLKWLPRLYTYWKQYGRHKSLYLMAASAYAGGDFHMHGAFRGKSYKWGYFPETMHYDVDALLSGKKKGRILWCGRFLDLKHPEAAVEVAKRLKAEGYDFHLDMIGTGELLEATRKSVEALDLTDCVSLLGSMTPEAVRTHMEQAQIFLFTSDFNEGWGAVLNEAMNSGCAVVASHAIGAAPFLVKHGKNGFLYENGDVDDLHRKVKVLLDQPQRQQEMGRLAYQTIVEEWNGETAAQRFAVFSQEIARHGRCDLFQDGPCSPAPTLKNCWFQKESIIK